jgi:hypothetical protein
MSDDEPTNPSTKFAQLVADGVQVRLEAMLTQPEVLDLVAARIASAVEARVKRELREVRLSQLTFEGRIHELERRVSNLESIVRSEDVQRVIQFARAANEPPPDTERG